MRWRAGKREPGLTTKVPPVICWILREMPKPCSSPVASDFKMSRSRVPCKRVVGSEITRHSYRTSIGVCSYTYRVSIGRRRVRFDILLETVYAHLECLLKKNIGEQPARQVLPADARGPEAIEGGDRQVGQTGGSDRAD